MAADTPLINELKEDSGSEKLHQCFKFLFIQEHTEDEAFIMYLGERCNELQRKIDKRSERMAEVWSLNHDEEEAGGDVYECLREEQIRERMRLEAIRAMLVEIRDGLTEKKHHMSIMDFYD